MGLGAVEVPVPRRVAPLTPMHLPAHVQREVADAQRHPVMVAEEVDAGVGRVGDADEGARPHLR
jgi:hypothetical protein